jgi:diguanylate cyclase (GGDEF)-like protein
MSELNLDALTTFSAETLGAAVMGLLLLGFYRQYHKSYLLHWCLGWFSMAGYHLAASVVTLLATRRMPASHPLSLLCAMISGAAGYLTLAWLLFGMYELVRRRPVKLHEARMAIITLAIFGAALALLFPSADSSAWRFFMRIGVRAFIATIAFTVASIFVLRARRRHTGMGFTLIGVSFLIYALEELQFFIVSIVALVQRQAEDPTFYFGYLDFVLQAATGMGMLACLLEDEREAADLATVEIEHLAYHDALTGLPNRPLFIDRLIVALAQAARANQKLAVFFLDLDRFKDINDSLGHSTGDALLKAVADRIRRCVRDGDTVARFGGDEFTLLVPRMESVDDAAKIAQKIIEVLKIPFQIADRELFVTTSIGIGLYPVDGVDPETLVRNADTAMYRAKEQGRDNYQLYAPAMNARALERLALENMLRKAITQNELELHYQPIVHAVTGEIVGVEALLRWNHPQLGLLSPAHFISVAEVSGLIIPIGTWALRVACKQVRQWQKKLHVDLKLSVNLSARQFQQPDLLEQIRNIVEETGLAPSNLELEITESNAMQNAENTIYTLREIKNIGVRIAMDDFGTGYSSLNYLKRFPIDTLKLDQSFVHDVANGATDAAIASAVIDMAHSLRLEVVAEGVETAEQLRFLQQQQCDRIQGYYFSPPLPVSGLENYIVTRRAAAAVTA